MENKEQRFQCTGDCLNCRKQPNERREQWMYCASQFTYNTMRKVEDLFADISRMVGEIEEMKAKIEAIQNNEATVLSPVEDNAQEGYGAG